MAILNEVFSIDRLPQSDNKFDPVPAGWYNATISGAELRTTKNGTGQYIAVKYSVTGPTHQGRIVFGNINIRNANPKAEEIGRMALGEMMRAIGLSTVQDTDELIGGNLMIKLVITQQEGYEPSNDVKGFKAIAGGSSPANFPSAQQQAPAQQAAPAAGTPPWAKR